MFKFIKKSPEMPNEILNGKNFYISYNPKTGVGNPFAMILGEITNIPNGLPETAIHFENTWYILNGDFRSQYEAVAENGIKAVLKVYQQNIIHRSDWSTDGCRNS